jgi:hypothetical protein
MVSDDIRRIGLNQKTWFEMAQKREEWRGKVHALGGREDGDQSEADAEHRVATHECDLCGKMLKNEGGLRIHRGSKTCDKAASKNAMQTGDDGVAAAVCGVCGQRFKAGWILERHRAVCGRPGRPTDADREQYRFPCGACQRRFRTGGDLSRHGKWCKGPILDHG